MTMLVVYGPDNKWMVLRVTRGGTLTPATFDVFDTEELARQWMLAH